MAKTAIQPSKFIETGGKMMKKRTKLGVSLALVGILAVGGTYAYLQFQTGPVENTFTFGDNVNGEIKEPHWDGECFEGETCDIEATGKQDAQNFTPGQTIAKDPQLKNTSNVPAYAAVKIEYTGVENDTAVTSYAALNKFAEIDWNTDDWYFNADHTLAIYKKALHPDENNVENKTVPVFTNVKINEHAVYPEAGETNDLAMHHFQINVKGYFAQADNMDGMDSILAVKTVFEDFKDFEAINK